MSASTPKKKRVRKRKKKVQSSKPELREVHVFITPRKDILDPQGAAVQGALHSLGYDAVKQLKIGRFMVLHVIDPNEEMLKAMCEKLLANPVVEDYRFEIRGTLPPT